MNGFASASSSNRATSTVAVCAFAAVFAVVGFVAVQPSAHYAPVAIRPTVQATMTAVPLSRSVQSEIVSAPHMQSQPQIQESSTFSQVSIMVFSFFLLP